MELMEKQGYKQTEVGLIPEDWHVNIVNDLIDLLTDYDANGSFSSVAENVKVFDYEKYAWYVRSTDLENNSSMNEVKYVDESSYKFLKKTALFGNELLFLKRGDIGNIYLFKMQTKFATVAPNLYLLKLNNKSSSSYLYYYFKSKHGQSQLKSKNASSTLGALYKDDVKSIYVPLPPTLEEQKAIATALSDVDELISNLDKLITKKKAIKQGAMQQLLMPPHKGGKRLEGFTGEWEEKKLGEFCKITTGKLDANAMVLDGDYRFYTCAKNFYFIDKYAFDTEALLISGNGANVGYIHYYKGKFNAYQRTYVLDEFSTDIKFMKCLLDKYLALRIDSEKNEGNTPYIKMDTLTEMVITLPFNIEEQKAIAEILLDMDVVIEQLEAKKAKHQNIKQGMMQELLIGKTRLV